MLLSDNYPFITNYFSTLLNAENRPLPQSILFYGNDFGSQYILSTEIARLLNCTKAKTDDCDCINCKWIRENTHPAVTVISRTDNKPDGDDSKTVISIKQSSMIKDQLVTTSEFHRVYIFCDRDEDGNISGLNYNNFQDETANSLLKIIEEPHPGVTFIFLTRYIEDVLPTIISRSQCFFIPAKTSINYDSTSIIGIFDNYWDFERKDAFDISQKLENLAKEFSPMQILEQIQNHILDVLKQYPNNYKLIEDIKLVEEAKKQVLLGIKPANIFDELCLKLIK